jgi:hypothetical protein
MQLTPILQEAPLEFINRVDYDFSRGRQILHKSSPPKVVSNEDDIRDFLGVISLSLGNAPTWIMVPRVNIRPKTMTHLSAEAATTWHDGLKIFFRRDLKVKQHPFESL